MQALHEKYENKDVVVLGVSIDESKTEVVRKFIKEMELTFLNVHDSSRKVSREYQIRNIPSTYILDIHGKAIGLAIGPRPWDSEDIDELINTLLEEK